MPVNFEVDHSYIIRPESFGGMIYDVVSKKLHRLNNEEYAELSSGKYKNVKIKGKNNSKVIIGLRAPIKLYLDITTQCNLKCKHCLSSSGTSNFSLTYDQIKKLAGELSEVGVFRVKLGGGEPLLHPDFWKIVDVLNNADMTVSISTNGILVVNNPDNARMFAEKNVKVSVSLDGDKKMHTYIRGLDSSYDLALKAIEVLTKHNVKTAIGSTLFPINLYTVKSVIEVAEKYNVPVKFKRAKPAGRAINNELVISKPTEEYWDTVRLINKSPLAKIEGIMDLGNKKKTKVLDNDYFNCGAGTATIHVDSWGNISPCVFLGPEFVSGNINKDNIKDVWERGKGFAKMRNVAVKGNDKCFNCPQKTVCCGECRAFALFVNHDLNAVDPCCPIDQIQTQ